MKIYAMSLWLSWFACILAAGSAQTAPVLPAEVNTSTIEEVAHAPEPANFPIVYSNSIRRAALVVSTAIYHYEVVAFFASHLQKLDYEVHVWLHPQSQHQYGGVEKFISPMADHIAFVGKGQNLTIPADLQALVYITMNNQFYDMVQLCGMHQMHNVLVAHAQSVIMVNHHANEVLDVQRVCKPPKCTIFHLGEHVHKYATMKLAANNITDYKSVFAVAVFEPPPSGVLPHAFRRQTPSFRVNKTRIIAIQGSIESLRRKYDKLFECVSKIRSKRVDLRLLAIGRRSGNVLIPKELEKYIIFLPWLAYEQFYSVIKKAEFLVSFGSAQIHYDSYRASSSVPTAIMNNIPIILPADISKHYPCIRSTSIYSKILQKDDCSSLQAAIALSPADLLALREEVSMCRKLWMFEATELLKTVIASSRAGNVTNTHNTTCSAVKHLFAWAGNWK